MFLYTKRTGYGTETAQNIYSLGWYGGQCHRHQPLHLPITAHNSYQSVMLVVDIVALLAWFWVGTVCIIWYVTKPRYGDVGGALNAQAVSLNLIIITACIGAEDHYVPLIVPDRQQAVTWGALHGWKKWERAPPKNVKSLGGLLCGRGLYPPKPATKTRNLRQLVLPSNNHGPHWHHTPNRQKNTITKLLSDPQPNNKDCGFGMRNRRDVPYRNHVHDIKPTPPYNTPNLPNKQPDWVRRSTPVEVFFRDKVNTACRDRGRKGYGTVRWSRRSRLQYATPEGYWVATGHNNRRYMYMLNQVVLRNLIRTKKLGQSILRYSNGGGIDERVIFHHIWVATNGGWGWDKPNLRLGPTNRKPRAWRYASLFRYHPTKTTTVYIPIDYRRGGHPPSWLKNLFYISILIKKSNTIEESETTLGGYTPRTLRLWPRISIDPISRLNRRRNTALNVYQKKSKLRKYYHLKREWGVVDASSRIKHGASNYKTGGWLSTNSPYTFRTTRMATAAWLARQQQLRIPRRWEAGKVPGLISYILNPTHLRTKTNSDSRFIDQRPSFFGDVSLPTLKRTAKTHPKSSTLTPPTSWYAYAKRKDKYNPNANYLRSEQPKRHWWAPVVEKPNDPLCNQTQTVGTSYKILLNLIGSAWLIYWDQNRTTKSTAEVDNLYNITAEGKPYTNQTDRLIPLHRLAATLSNVGDRTNIQPYGTYKQGFLKWFPNFEKAFLGSDARELYHLELAFYKRQKRYQVKYVKYHPLKTPLSPMSNTLIDYTGSAKYRPIEQSERRTWYETPRQLVRMFMSPSGPKPKKRSNIWLYRTRTKRFRAKKHTNAPVWTISTLRITPPWKELGCWGRAERLSIPTNPSSTAHQPQTTNDANTRIVAQIQPHLFINYGVGDGRQYLRTETTNPRLWRWGQRDTASRLFKYHFPAPMTNRILTAQYQRTKRLSNLARRLLLHNKITTLKSYTPNQPVLPEERDVDKGLSNPTPYYMEESDLLTPKFIRVTRVKQKPKRIYPVFLGHSRSSAEPQTDISVLGMDDTPAP